MTAAPAIAVLPALSPADLTPDDAGEPRVLDLAVAARLGFDRPNNIRKLITRHRAELECYGPLAEVEDVAANLLQAGANSDALRGGANPANNSPRCGAKSLVPPKRGRGRPGRAFMLSRDQAMVAAVLSRAPHAPAVRRQLVEAFNAYRAGLRPPPAAAPAIGDPVGRAIARLVPDDGAEWHGAPADLLRALARVAPEADRRRLGWPASPRCLGLAVDRLTPELQRQGIAVERRRSARRIIRLVRGSPSPALEWDRAERTVPARTDAGELARLRTVVAGQAEELGALRGRIAALEILAGRGGR